MATTQLLETHMNTISSKLTALAMALIINTLIMGAVGFLFELQSHPHLSVISFARQLAAHQWFG
jgi:Mg2+ and Co2+ transporter CorA